jgi:hypothetical protein
MRRVQEWEHPPSKPFNKDGTKAKPWMVVLWEDGTYSCNCPAWTKAVDNPTGERACKHIARVLLKRMQPILDGPARVELPVTAPPMRPGDTPGRRRIVLED